jgi:hypothetical protein
LHDPVDISGDNLRLGDLGPRLVRVAGGLGVVGLVLSLVLALLMDNGGTRFVFSYLVSFAYFLSLALGALFFVMVQHVCRAGWSVVLRRLAEGVAHNVVLMAALSLVILLGMKGLYHWTHADAVAHDHLLQIKRPFLNVPFFLIRVVIYFGVWVWLARYFFWTSVLQDETGDVSLSLRMQRTAAPGLLIFGLTTTFASFDFLMTLDPHWFSTIFGVYYFAGCVVGFASLLALMIVLLQRSGRLRIAISREHFHDVGKLILAFVVFWAYIAFSQYMLIWYANIPEETGWFLKRQTGGWAALSIVLLVGHFFVPFFAFMSRHPKRRRVTLAAGAILVLAMHWLDLYWLVMPELHKALPESVPAGRLPFHLLDLTCFVGIGGLFVAFTAYRLTACDLLPSSDPRLEESLAFENV